VWVLAESLLVAVWEALLLLEKKLGEPLLLNHLLPGLLSFEGILLHLEVDLEWIKRLLLWPRDLLGRWRFPLGLQLPGVLYRLYFDINILQI